MKKIGIILFVILSNVGVYAQKTQTNLKDVQPSLDFRFVEKGLDSKTVVFTIIGVKNKQHEQKLITKITAHSGVKSFKIFYGRRCKMVLENTVTANDIRGILISENTDFDIDYVKADPLTATDLRELKRNFPFTNLPEPIATSKWAFPADYPQMQKTGDDKANKLKYKEAKEKWIEEHADEYRKITGLEYLDYSLKKVVK